MQIHRLYKYDNYSTAVVVTGLERNTNMPISNEKVKVYKGSNQTLKFGIFNADGKPFYVSDPLDNTPLPQDLQLSLSVIDSRSGKQVIYKDLELSTTNSTIPPNAVQSVKRNITYFECKITVQDTKDLNANTPYRYVVFERDDNHVQGELLYTSINNTVPGVFELLDTGTVQFVPSQDTGPSSEWMEYYPSLGNAFNLMDPSIVKTKDLAITNGYVMRSSSTLPSSAQSGTNATSNTVVVYPNNFSGTLKIRGTLSNDVPQIDNNIWFDVPDVNGVVYHEFTESSDLKSITFKGSYMWIRFEMYSREYPQDVPTAPQRPEDVPESGTITKILYRY